jgi:hypothetical protein
MNLLRKSIRYLILFAAESALGLLTLFCLQVEGNQFQTGVSELNLTRYISQLFMVLINLLWALKTMEGSEKNKRIIGILSGIFLLVMTFALTRLSNPDNNMVLLLAIFAGQIIFWEICTRASLVHFKPKKQSTL